MNEENIVLCGVAVEQSLIHSTLPSIFSFTLPTGPTGETGTSKTNTSI
ncbi:exosporium leader peptide-containing protein [Bacillus mycoides]